MWRRNLIGAAFLQEYDYFDTVVLPLVLGGFFGGNIIALVLLCKAYPTLCHRRRPRDKHGILYEDRQAWQAYPLFVRVQDVEEAVCAGIMTGSRKNRVIKMNQDEKQINNKTVSLHSCRK